MSAECGTCGFDIVYPIGTWPIGECPNCTGADFRHNTHRMLQALDAYWLHCDGLPNGRYPRGRYDMEDWWIRFEKYRAALGEARQ